MMHFRKRVTIENPDNANKRNKKYSKWRKGYKRNNHFLKYCQIQKPNLKWKHYFMKMSPR